MQIEAMVLKSGVGRIKTDFRPACPAHFCPLQMGRYNYVTPTSYLELILAFTSLLASKRQEVNDQSPRIDPPPLPAGPSTTPNAPRTHCQGPSRTHHLPHSSLGPASSGAIHPKSHLAVAILHGILTMSTWAAPPCCSAQHCHHLSLLCCLLAPAKPEGRQEQGLSLIQSGCTFPGALGMMFHALDRVVGALGEHWSAIPSSPM